jgi:hypothetical protein
MDITRGRIIAIVLAIATAGLVFVLWPRESVSPEELIKRKALQMARAAEEKDVGFIMDQVSEQFRGSDGLDKQTVKAVIAGRVLRGDWVRVFVVKQQAKLLSADEAEYSGRFVFGRADVKSVEELPRDSALNAYVIDARVKKEADGEWRFISATHRVADPSELF